MGATTKPGQSTSEAQFVVGVDFGTTFTSVAFAHSASPEAVKLVQNWPNGGTGNSSADQVPTVVTYTNPQTRQKCWGYEAPPAVPPGQPPHEPLRWFKLLLQENPISRQRNSNPVARRSSFAPSLGGWETPPSPAPPASPGNRLLLQRFQDMAVSSNSSDAGSWSGTFRPPSITPALKTAEILGKFHIPPVAVVEDFLSAVRKKAVDSIKRTYQKDWVEDSRISYVLTVPAIWSDSAKNFMIQAAERAGFGAHREGFDLISEPEAAAAYTVKAIQPNNLQRGDTFVIVDAGGGTVDLISYKISGLNPLRLDESVSGTGDLCGSVFLDERFERYIRRLLGNNVIDNMNPRAKAEMMRTWEERVKFRFGLSTVLEVTLPGVPDDPEKRIEYSLHTMREEDVKKIFDPVVDRIEDLVTKQVRSIQSNGQNVAAILLVGGFGSSEYLHSRLKKARYGTGRTIQVLQPVDARTAIARGALLRGLDGSIVRERRSRRFYGCESTTHYEPGKGLEDHMYWCEKNDDWRVEDKLTWYVKKNEVVGHTVSVSFSFHRTLEVSENPDERPSLLFSDDLVACDIDDAPDFKWQNPSAVQRICTVHSDLSAVQIEDLPKKRRANGKSYCKVKYQLKLTILNEVLRFELVHQGTTKGTATTRFDDTSSRW